MGYTDAMKHMMLARAVGKTTPNTPVTALSLHTADPTTVGDNEVSGGGYARITVSDTDFDAPGATTGGEVELNNDKQFAGPASQSVSHFGCWNSTTFLGGGALSGDLAFNAAGEYVLKTGTSLDLNS